MINDAILSVPDLVEIVIITTIGCYKSHLTPSADLSDIEINNMRLTIGHVYSLYKELVAHWLSVAENGFNQETVDRANENRNAIKNNMDLLPTLETLQTLSVSCSKDIFLEVLIMSIKDFSFAHQHEFFRSKTQRENCSKTNQRN
jgi:hypothetical protein